MSEDRSLERIAGLLNQAENTTNEAEAAAFMEAAQRLATLRGVDLARARSHTKSKETTKPVQRSVVIGERKTKGLRTFTDLFCGIAQANDVKVTIFGNGYRVNAHGYAEDVDMTERLYASLVVQMVAASQAFIKGGEWKSETVWREGRYRKPTQAEVASGEYYRWDHIWEDGGERPISALTARLEFQKAFADRIETRLAIAKREAEKAAEAEDVLSDAEVGTALVLADKKDQVERFFKEVNPRLRGYYRGHQSSTYSRGSRNAGYNAANNARLSASQALPGGRKGIAS